MGQHARSRLWTSAICEVRHSRYWRPAFERTTSWDTMSRAFVNEDAGGGPRRDFHLPPREDPGYEAAAAAVLLEGARQGDTAAAEDATGFRWGDPALARHVRSIGRQAEANGDERLAQLAARFLR